MAAELGVIEALVMVRRHKCRVTFGDEVVIEEERGRDKGGGDNRHWCVVGRAATFVEAARFAMEACGWER